jgi:hypothetical protein
MFFDFLNLCHITTFLFKRFFSDFHYEAERYPAGEGSRHELGQEFGSELVLPVSALL